MLWRASFFVLGEDGFQLWGGSSLSGFVEEEGSAEDPPLDFSLYKTKSPRELDADHCRPSVNLTKPGSVTDRGPRSSQT